jgi:hypothetical protein
MRFSAYFGAGVSWGAPDFIGADTAGCVPVGIDSVALRNQPDPRRLVNEPRALTKQTMAGSKLMAGGR